MFARLKIGIVCTALLATVGCASHSSSKPKPPSACDNGYALALVVDKSGSVGKSAVLDGAKRALVEIIPKLEAETELSIIAFDEAPFVLVNNLQMNREGKEKALTRIKLILPFNSTEPSAGLVPAVDQLHRSTKACKAMVFLSDGKFKDPISADILQHIGSRSDIDRVASLMLGEGGDPRSMKLIAEYWGGEFIAISKLDKSPQILAEILQRWGLIEASTTP